MVMWANDLVLVRYDDAMNFIFVYSISKDTFSIISISCINNRRSGDKTMNNNTTDKLHGKDNDCKNATTINTDDFQYL